MSNLSAVDNAVGAYASKALTYFSGARYDYVGALPVNPDAKILEVGCGNGGSGALALSQGKCGTYCGVEICDGPAEIARARITTVIHGDIEEIELPWEPRTFDVLILSEVLEHLVDPWRTLRKLRPAIKAGGLVFASSPNVSQYRVLAMLLRGDWTLTDCGVMDRTHLRWFTPKTYAGLFAASGYVVDSVHELMPFGVMARLANLATMGRLRHLFVRQINLRAHCP